MVKQLKKLVLDFSNGLVNEKKVVTVAKEDRDDKERYKYYLEDLRGSKRFYKRVIRREEYEAMCGNATSISLLKSY